MDDVYAMGGGFTIVSGGQTGADRAGLEQFEHEMLSQAVRVNEIPSCAQS